jgi:hypothetical protein
MTFARLQPDTTQSWSFGKRDDRKHTVGCILSYLRRTFLDYCPERDNLGITHSWDIAYGDTKAESMVLPAKI